MFELRGNQRYHAPDTFGQDALEESAGRSEVRGLWEKLWPRKQARDAGALHSGNMKGGCTDRTCSILKEDSLKTLDDEQQHDQQLADAESGRRWWAIAAATEALVPTAPSTSAAAASSSYSVITENATVVSSSYAASKQYSSSSSYSSSSQAMSSSMASYQQQQTSCSKIGTQLHSSSSSSNGPKAAAAAAEAVAASKALGKHSTIAEEDWRSNTSTSGCAAQLVKTFPSSARPYNKYTFSKRSSTTSCSSLHAQQPQYHTDKAAAKRAFTAAYSRSGKRGSCAASRSSKAVWDKTAQFAGIKGLGSSSSSRLPPAALKRLHRLKYSERDLLKLKQLGRVEEQTLMACVEDLPQLVQDGKRSKVLGSGSYGTVYQLLVPWPCEAVAAEVAAAFPDRRFASGMPVVVKQVEHNPADLEWSREMCQREEAACVQVNGSAWAPQLLWAGHTCSSSWFVFEELTPDPINLDDCLSAQPVLPTETIFHIVDQLGRALDDLHRQRGLVHNDLKPAQVCLPRRVLAASRHGPAPLPRLYLVDYGISCPPGTPIVEHGFGGTLIYMDPQLKCQALKRVALTQDKVTGDLELQYKVLADPPGQYHPTYDYFSLGQILAFILAKGSESLHQKIVCLVTAAYAAGNTPELYCGVRALVCDHPSATKGLLDVLCALLGPQDSRPGSYRELQKLLVRARMECRPEPVCKEAWESIHGIVCSGNFCHYDDEVLVGQMESSNCSIEAAAPATDAAAAAAEAEAEAEAAASEQHNSKDQHKQDFQKQEKHQGPLKSFAQCLRSAKFSSKHVLKQLITKLGAAVLPCLAPEVVHASEFMRPAAADNGHVSSMPSAKADESSSSSSADSIASNHARSAAGAGAGVGAGAGTAGSSRIGASHSSLNSESLVYRRQQLQQLLSKELQLDIVSSDDQPSKVSGDIADLEYYMFGCCDVASEVPGGSWSSTDIDLMSKVESSSDLVAAPAPDMDQLLILSDHDESNLGPVTGSSTGASSTDQTLGLFDLMVLLPDQAVDQLMEMQEMLSWLLLQ